VIVIWSGKVDQFRLRRLQPAPVPGHVPNLRSLPQAPRLRGRKGFVRQPSDAVGPIVAEEHQVPHLRIVSLEQLLDAPHLFCSAALWCDQRALPTAEGPRERELGCNTSAPAHAIYAAHTAWLCSNPSPPFRDRGLACLLHTDDEGSKSYERWRTSQTSCSFTTNLASLLSGMHHVSTKHNFHPFGDASDERSHAIPSRCGPARSVCPRGVVKCSDDNLRASFRNSS
jgi:hypothetical protein